MLSFYKRALALRRRLSRGADPGSQAPRARQRPAGEAQERLADAASELRRLDRLGRRRLVRSTAASWLKPGQQTVNGGRSNRAKMPLPGHDPDPFRDGPAPSRALNLDLT